MPMYCRRRRALARVLQSYRQHLGSSRTEHDDNDDNDNGRGVEQEAYPACAIRTRRGTGQSERDDGQQGNGNGKGNGNGNGKVPQTTMGIVAPAASLIEEQRITIDRVKEERQLQLL